MTRLEDTKYDRPSLHSDDAVTRAIGRLSAVMDQHIEAVHLDYWGEHGVINWKCFCCELCGFNAAMEVRRLYPEALEVRRKMSFFAFQQGENQDGEPRIVITASSDDGIVKNELVFPVDQFEEFLKTGNEALIKAKANLKLKDKN